MDLHVDSPKAVTLTYYERAAILYLLSYCYFLYCYYL